MVIDLSLYDIIEEFYNGQGELAVFVLQEKVDRNNFFFLGLMSYGQMNAIIVLWSTYRQKTCHTIHLAGFVATEEHAAL